MTDSYETWFDAVRKSLNSINMPLDDWQERWPFDFRNEYKAKTPPQEAAGKANRYWWQSQNKAINQHCVKTPNCWLPRGHSDNCQPLP
jgi:hypothetical protein